LCTLVLSRVLKNKKCGLMELFCGTFSETNREVRKHKNEGTTTMKAIVIAALLALSFTTGFTCSKNQPAEQTETPAATTEAAPAATTEAAPAEGQPAATTEAAPATTEAAPAGQTK